RAGWRISRCTIGRSERIKRQDGRIRASGTGNPAGSEYRYPAARPEAGARVASRRRAGKPTEGARTRELPRGRRFRRCRGRFYSTHQSGSPRASGTFRARADRVQAGAERTSQPRPSPRPKARRMDWPALDRLHLRRGRGGELGGAGPGGGRRGASGGGAPSAGTGGAGSLSRQRHRGGARSRRIGGSGGVERVAERTRARYRGRMKNLGQLMKQAQAMQTRMAEMQAELERVEMTGQAG